MNCRAVYDRPHFVDSAKNARSQGAVNELQASTLPSLERRGGCAIKKYRKAPLVRADDEMDSSW